MEVPMFCPSCGNDNAAGSLTCSKCAAALPVAQATPPATVPSATQTNATPVIAGAALARMGDRAIATILDLVAAGAAFALVGMWAAVRLGGVTRDGVELQGTAAGLAIGAVALLTVL